MIRYALICEHAHAFEGWFGSSGDFDDQSARGLVACPVCESRAVEKQIMAPSVAGTKKSQAADLPPQVRSMVMEAMGKVRAHVEENFDYVGDAFAGRHEGANDLHRAGVLAQRLVERPAEPLVQARVEEELKQRRPIRRLPRQHRKQIAEAGMGCHETPHSMVRQPRRPPGRPRQAGRKLARYPMAPSRQALTARMHPVPSALVWVVWSWP